MRDRLIELISQVQYMGGLEGKLADHLLAEGVIVPPCKVGDEINGEIVHKIDYKEFLSQGGVHTEAFVHTMNKDDLNSIIFCSHPIKWEEAEKALAERNGSV